MAQVMTTDGFVIDVSDDDPLLRRDIPRVEYETSQENYDTAQTIYDKARRIGHLRNNPDHLLFISDLKEKIQQKAAILLACTDKDKKDKAWQDHRDLRIVLDYCNNTINEAATVPRPLLHKVSQ